MALLSRRLLWPEKEASAGHDASHRAWPAGAAAEDDCNAWCTAGFHMDAVEVAAADTVLVAAVDAVAVDDCGYGWLESRDRTLLGQVA